MLMSVREPDLRLPDHVRRLREDEHFSFACHPGVPCFTECCRQLELALSPYDVLRLARELGMSGRRFLERYAVVESEEDAIFPQVYLGMVDDGRESCPFISAQGCRVYPNRPAACRTYPLGRGAWRDNRGTDHVFFVLLTEPHCRGFAEPTDLTLDRWITGQGLADYYAANDILIPLLQHERIRQGFRPGPEQRDLYLATLYNLEEWGRNSDIDMDGMTDLEMLRSAASRLIDCLFP